MNHKLLFFLSIFFISILGVNSQNKSISEINSFLKENSSGNKNYWTQLKIENNNLLIYNSPNSNIQKYSFPINKIDFSNIKASKKRILIKGNTPGEHVSYKFGVERKESVAAILIYGMSKPNRLKLTEQLSILIKNIQKPKLQINITELKDANNLNQIFWNLFLNSELSTKNYNLSTIYDYVTNNNQNDIHQIILTSNLGHNTENVTFFYDKEKKLIRVKYSVDRNENKGFILFDYNLIYSDNYLKSIKIKGKEKYKFDYSNNLLTSVTLNDRGIQSIYNIKYDIVNKKANLNQDINRDGKFYKFVNKNHKGQAEDTVSWNNDYLLSSYSLGTYFTEKINYDEKGNVSSFNYSSVNNDNNPIDWQYTFDQKGNFITKTNGKLLIERSIIYQ